MKLQGGSSQRVDNFDTLTVIDEELLSLFVLDSQIERELNASPNSASPFTPNEMDPMPASSLCSARSSSQFSNNSSLYMKSAEVHEETTSNRPFEYPKLPPSNLENQTILQNSFTIHTTPGDPGMLRYSRLPLSSAETSFNEVDRSFTSPSPDFECSFTFTDSHGPPVVERNVSSTVEVALDQERTPKADNNTGDSGPDSRTQRVQSGTYHSSARVDNPETQLLIKGEDGSGEGTAAGVPLTKLAIYGQNKLADDVLTNLYADDYDLSEIDFAKSTSSQYIPTKTQQPLKEVKPTLDEKPILEDKQRVSTVTNKGIGQTIVTSHCNIDSLDKEPRPECKKCSADALLAELYAEDIDLSEIDLTEDSSANQPSVSIPVMKTEVHTSVGADLNVPGENQNSGLRIFEENNAFIKFYLGISANAATFDISNIPKAATLLPSTPTQVRAIPRLQRRSSPRKSLPALEKSPVHIFPQASLVFRPRQPCVDRSTDQISLHPKSHLLAFSQMCSNPDRAPPGLDHHTGHDLAPRSQTQMQGRSSLASRPRQRTQVQGGSFVHPLPMSTKLLAHLPKTNTHLDAQSLKHLEWAYNIWYADPATPVASNTRVEMLDHASQFDDPDWTAEEWLSIEQENDR
ncbi:hypothetical protein MMC11_001817 [Xylographa trunciseda]|nr:hypothetical protein [Xylographa trunciseda]